jgi:protoheme IX farnesyltransferase
MRRIGEYYALTKSGLVYGNLVTVIAGFVLASEGGAIAFGALAAAIVGMAFVMASGCVFNNVIDRDLDAHMARTKARALVEGRIAPRPAIIFGGILAAIGFAVLAWGTTLLAAFLAAFGFFVYVFAYSMWTKRRTVYGTAVGAVAGAMPPVVGYAAAGGHLDLAAATLFAVMITWQMAHFFSIAIRRRDEYAAGNVPVMPVRYGIRRTKASMVAYILEFIVAASLFTLLRKEGYVFLMITLALGMVWLGFGVRGLFITDASADRAWATHMFIVSIVVMVGFFAALTIGAALFS